MLTLWKSRRGRVQCNVKELHLACNVGLFFSLLILALSSEITMVAAQSDPSESDSGIINEYPHTRFSLYMAIIIVVTIGALFFVGLVSIYIRYCFNRSMHSDSAAAAVGLDPSVIESFLTFSYSEVKDREIGKESLECAVCLNEFEDEQTLCSIHKCNHVFHLECIGAWLDSHVTCPVCRTNLVPLAGHVPELTNVESTSHLRNDAFVTQVAGCTESQPEF